MNEASASYPGQSIGLPETGRGSLAPWRNRFAALIVDWAASMMLATALFGREVLTGHGWQAWMVLAVFFVESSVLTTLASGSFGQLLARVAVVRLDRQPLGWWLPTARCAMKCIVIPFVVIGAERRSMADMLLGTVVINRR